MNAIQENTLSMYGAVDLVLGNHQDSWTTLPAIATAVTDFKGCMTRINTLERSRNGGTKGVTADKQTARDAMTTAGLEVAGAVRAYAASIQSGELRAKVDYLPSYLDHARDTEVVNVCQGIHDTANEIVGPLTDFGVTAQVLTAFQEKITNYNQLLPKPRATMSDSRASGKLLEIAFESADTVLEERLDGLMQRYRTVDPAFFAAYCAAREVVNNASGHAPPEGSNGGNGANGGNGGNQTPTPPTTTPTA